MPSKGRKYSGILTEGHHLHNIAPDTVPVRKVALVSDPKKVRQWWILKDPLWLTNIRVRSFKNF